MKYSNKHIALTLMFALVSAYIAIAMHTAEHGPLEHTHHGVQCEIYTFHDKNHTDISKDAIVATPIETYVSTLPSVIVRIFSKPIVRQNLTRAPPYIA